MSGVEIPTGYTPGPWRNCVDADEYSVDRYEDGDDGLCWTAVGPEDGEAVALVVVPMSFGMDDEQGANARLIALAPEMAVELQRLRAALDVDHLSNIIRRVDGSHSLGAGALAEKIVEAIKREIRA